MTRVSSSRFRESRVHGFIGMQETILAPGDACFLLARNELRESGTGTINERSEFSVIVESRDHFFYRRIYIYQIGRMSVYGLLGFRYCVSLHKQYKKGTGYRTDPHTSPISYFDSVTPKKAYCFQLPLRA